MRQQGFRGLGPPCLFAVAIAAAAGGCSSNGGPDAAEASGGAGGGDSGAEAAAFDAGHVGGFGGSGASEAGQVDAPGDVDWAATCGAAVQSGPGACLWGCGCQHCARVTAECLANAACRAIVDCAIEQDCTNDPDGGARSCRVMCANVLLLNYTAGGLLASAIDQCTAASCKVACLTDGGAAETSTPPDTGPDGPADGPKTDAADVSVDDAPADAARADAVADVATPDAPADATTADAPEDAQDGAEAGWTDAAAD